MEVTKRMATKLFRNLGYATAHTWTTERIQSRINRLVDVIDPDGEYNLDEKYNQLLSSCLTNAGNIKIIETPQEEAEEPSQPTETFSQTTKTEPKNSKNERGTKMQTNETTETKPNVSKQITELMKQGIWDKKEIAKRLGVHIRRVHVQFYNLIKRGVLVKDGDTYRFTR